jgi:hypothetical protein
VSQLAHTVRDQLQHAVQVEDSGDAASGAVERGKLHGSLARSGARPRGPDDDLQAASTLVDGDDRGRRSVQLQGRQDAVAEPELVRSETGRLGTLVEQAAGP